MDYLRIQGPTKLSGTVTISGAKNAALPLITLALLAHNPLKITNMPEVADIKTLLKLLQNLGASCSLKEHVLMSTPQPSITRWRTMTSSKRCGHRSSF